MFCDYNAAGFGPELLPIIPPNAHISLETKSMDDLLKGRGKVPGKRGKEGWFGFTNWTGYRATPDDHKNWGSWRCGVGLQGRLHPAIDIDVDQADIASALRSTAIESLGDAPTRSRGTPRSLLVYAGEGLYKRRLSFVPADAPEGTKPWAVEFLASGQQYVIEGVHPSGAKYEWWEGRSPAKWGADALTRVSAEEVDVFFDKARELVESRGCKVVNDFKGSGVGRTGVPLWTLRAPSHEAACAALDAIPNEFGYDEWHRILVAFYAAAGGSGEAFEHFTAWSASSPADDPEFTEGKWRDLEGRPLSIGWHALAIEAARVTGDPCFGAKWEFDAVSEPPFGGRFVYIKTEDKVIDLSQSNHAFGEKNFNNSYGELQRPPSKGVRPIKPWTAVLDALRKHDHPADPTRLERVVREPGHGHIVKESTYNPMREKVELAHLNLWRPSPAILNAPQDVTRADVQPFIDLHRRLHQGEGSRMLERTLQLLAAPIARPGLKTGRILVAHTNEGGTGKGLATLRVLLDALGPDAYKMETLDNLAAQHNEYRQGLALCIPEIDAESRAKVSGILKGLMDEDGGLAEVNHKYGFKVRVRDCLNVYINTNHLNFLPMDNNPRRWWVLSPDLDPLTPEEVTSYLRWYEGGGREKVIGFLAHKVDMAADHGWWRSDSSVGTAGTQKALKQSEPVILQELREVLDGRTLILEPRRLTGELRAERAVSRHTEANANISNISRHLRTLGYVQSSQVEKVSISKELALKFNVPRTCRPYLLAPTLQARRAVEDMPHALLKAKIERAVQHGEHLPMSQRGSGSELAPDDIDELFASGA